MWVNTTMARNTASWVCILCRYSCLKIFPLLESLIKFFVVDTDKMLHCSLLSRIYHTHRIFHLQSYLNNVSIICLHLDIEIKKVPQSVPKYFNIRPFAYGEPKKILEMSPFSISIATPYPRAYYPLIL